MTPEEKLKAIAEIYDTKTTQEVDGRAIIISSHARYNLLGAESGRR